MKPILPRTVIWDCMKAMAAASAGAACSWAELTRRNLEQKGIWSFHRVWRLPRKLEAGIKVGRGRFRRAWPYRRVIDVPAEFIDPHEIYMRRAVQRWALSTHQRNILDLVVRGRSNQEMAIALSRTEDQVARELSRIYERANIPQDHGNRRVMLVLAFFNLPSSGPPSRPPKKPPPSAATSLPVLATPAAPRQQLGTARAQRQS